MYKDTLSKDTSLDASNFNPSLQNGHPVARHERAVAMTSLILENADLNRLFPKCRPRGGPPPAPGASTQSNQQPHDSPCQTEAAAITTVTAATAATAAVTIASTNTSTSVSAISDDMIDLERDTSDRQVKPIYRAKRGRSI